MGREDSDSSPVRVNSPSWNASRPVTRRARVPALPQSIVVLRSPRKPTPRTRSSSPSSTSAPSARTAARVDSVSAERPKPRIVVSPSETAPISSARCEIDLSPGTAKCPSRAAAGSTRIEHRRHDDAVALALEQRRGALRLALAGDEQRQRAAALRRDVVQLEVLDVDPLRAERLRDAGEDARPVGDVHAQPLQLPRVGILALEHPPAVPGRLADPAREKARVALLERRLDLLDSAAVLRERGADRLGVVEVDVDPDARIGARDARHVSERPTCMRERLVALDARGARL